MTIGQAIVLGIVQGLGEYLPISSSGHLIVVPWLLGWTVQSLSFDVALHVGTLFAVLWAFAGDWWRLLSGAWRGLRAGRPFQTEEGRLLLCLVLASIPGAVAGVLLEKWADTTFRTPALVGVTMAVMGLVLLLADRRAEGGTGTLPSVSLRDAMIIGTAQALALVPGVSRSGSTISAALFLRYKREDAARFSFLLATPITAGAALMKVPHLLKGGDHGVVAAGMVAAAVVGFASIKLLLAYVRTHTYRPFVWYRLAFALLIAVVYFMHWRG